MPDTRDDSIQTGLAEVLRFSWPASLSMLNGTLTRFIDGLMIAHLGADLGQASLAAQGAASILAFAPESFAMGTLGVVNTYVSQNMGYRRNDRCGQYTWAGLALAMLFAAVIGPLGVLLAGPLFGLIGHAPQVQQLEVVYFRYMVGAIGLTLPSRVLESFLFGVHRPMLVFVISLASNAVNIAGNYALIYGHWGFPPLGLEGAAIASVVSWGLQLIILLAVFLVGDLGVLYHTRRIGAFTWAQMREILTIGWPAGLQFCNDILSWSIFTAVLVGRFGQTQLAASTAVMRYLSLSFMPAVGIGIAATALVGKYIGEGRPDLAVHRTRVALKTAMIYMGLCAIAFWVFRRPMMRFFAVVEPGQVPTDLAEFVEIGAVIMILAAIFQLFDAVGIIYAGSLRGAGDTRWPMVATMALSWGLTVGLGWIILLGAPGLQSAGPWIAASAYVIVLGVVLAWRFEAGAWRKIDLLGRGPAGTPAPETAPAAHAPADNAPRLESVDISPPSQ